MSTHREEVGERDSHEARHDVLQQREGREIDGTNPQTHGAKLDGSGKHGAEDAAVRRLNRYLIALLLTITLSVFSTVRQADFVHWDDGVNIYQNPHIRGVTAESLRWMFTDMNYIPRYMPLGWLSLAVDYDLAGKFNPATYHVGNLLLHCLNALLVFALLKRLLQLDASARGRTLDPQSWLVAAAVGALFWAIHPLRAEPVAWASARIYCVASCLAFSAAWCYLRHAAQPRGKLWLWLSALCFLASLFTYPIALGLAVVFVVLDFYPLRKLEFSKNGLLSEAARRVWWEKAPFVLAAFLVVTATMWARTHSRTFIPPVSLDDFGIVPRAMQAFFVWAAYLWKTWWPFHLTPMYTDLVTFDPWSWPFLLSALAVIGLTTALFLRRQRWSGAATAWVAYLILLVPMLGLSEHPHHPNDRYSYIPGVLWSLVVAAFLLRIWPRRERVASLALCGAVLVTCGILSFQQASHWRNRQTLLTHITTTLKAHPLRASQDVLLGFVHRDRGDDERAAACFRAALEADPNSADAHGALADVLSEHRMLTESLPHYREALRLNPKLTAIRENYAVTLGGLGQFENAAENFRGVIQLNATNATAHHNLGLTLARLGQNDAARAAFAEAERLRGQ